MGRRQAARVASATYRRRGGAEEMDKGERPAWAGPLAVWSGKERKWGEKERGAGFRPSSIFSGFFAFSKNLERKKKEKTK